MDADIIQQWAPIIGFILPAIQNIINQIFTDDIKFWKITIPVAEQRFILSMFLSLVIGIAASVKVYGFNPIDILQHSTEVFALSQLSFYSFFKTRTPQNATMSETQ